MCNILSIAGLIFENLNFLEVLLQLKMNFYRLFLKIRKPVWNITFPSFQEQNKDKLKSLSKVHLTYFSETLHIIYGLNIISVIRSMVMVSSVTLFHLLLASILQRRAINNMT